MFKNPNVSASPTIGFVTTITFDAGLSHIL
jgi:hypothetical protein